MPRILRHLACCALFAGLMVGPRLHAQLNPKWQSTASPDFLDLYQQSNAAKLKPEIVTVFDFSGSMQTMMYHKNFLNTNLGDAGDNEANLSISLMPSSGRTATNVYVRVSITVNGTTYSNSYNPGTSGTDGSGTNFVALRRPDGSPVTRAGVASYSQSRSNVPGETAATKVLDVRNWVRCASHARITVGTRTLDLPLAWTILDKLTVQPTSTDKRKMYDTWPLKMTLQDPITGTEVEMDSLYQVNGNNVLTNSSTTVSPTYSGYKGSYLKWLFNIAGANSYDGTPFPVASTSVIPDATSVGGGGFNNGIPARTRTQGVKEGALRTWARYYNQVFWAFRFLNNQNGSSGTNEDNVASASLYMDSRNDFPSSDPTSTPTIAGGQRGWVLLNKDSLGGMRKLAAYLDGGGTPLTWALGNTLAQLNDPNNIFNDVAINTNTAPLGDPSYDASKDNAPKECMKHFVILFTDGVPNESPTPTANTPYVDASGVGAADTGNAAIISSPASINSSGTNWNIMNLSAVAAHLGDTTLASHLVPGTYPSSGTWPTSGGMSPQAWLPFAIKSRGTGTNKLTFNKPHQVQVMTVGVSLAGKVTDTNSPKRRMFLAATFGDPAMTSWNLNSLKPFEVLDPTNPDSPKDPNSVYYFDATDPEVLVESLNRAFQAASALSNVNSTAAPVFPFLGAGLGHQVYLSQFKPPDSGGPVWRGDLMMFPTQEVNGTTKILDASGNQVTTALDKATPQWSASTILKNRGWNNRIIYTRVQATTSSPNPPMVRFSDTGSAYTYLQGVPLYKSDGTVERSSILPGTGTTQLQTVQWMMGADITGSTTPLPTRQDIMGDVIDASPAVIEYSTLDTSKLPPGSTLGSYWQTGRKFRVVFVGTNQGFLHAFGEVSWDSEVINAQGVKTTVTNGVADELWSFIPTDVLPYIDYFRNQSNSHRFGVNGQPTAYLLDLPGTGAISGNGMMDPDNASERAFVIFGLGRGGRSYYGIDVRDPFNPKLGVSSGSGGWALCPDESASISSARFEGIGGSSAVVAKMGYSTSVPAIGRVFYDTGSYVDMAANPSGKGKVRDAVFLGGGYSLPEVEAKNGNTQLGRSIVALDVNTGKVLKTWDLSTYGAGPVSAGAVPTSVFPTSGLVQRAYAADLYGNLFAVGSTEKIQGGDYYGFRVDRHQLDNWNTRVIYKNGLSVKSNGIVSTLPSTFLMGSFFARTTTPYVAPLTIGIAMISGDRNNPVDTGYSSSSTTPIYQSKPTQHRLTMLFDRQDSMLLNLDSNGIPEGNLYDMTSQTTPYASVITPGNSEFYVTKGYHGYYLKFDARGSGSYVMKGITSPLVLSGVLYYSTFSPSSYDPCTGGQGTTYTTRICDALKPVIGGTVNGCTSGVAATWTGVASKLSAKSVVSALQAGTVPGGGSGGGSTTTAAALQVQTYAGNVTERFAKPRTWRTVH